MTPRQTRRANGFRAFRYPSFRRFFLGQIPSVSGTFLQQTALGWLVLRQTGSASQLGLVLAAGSLPTLVLGPWGGAVADRLDLRRLLLGTQVAFSALAGLLWLAAARGQATVGVIVGVSLASGLVAVVDSPARQTFVGELVPPDDIASAVSVNGVVVNGARVVGPALAGLLIATVGTTPCFAINALSYLTVIAALLTIPSLPAADRSGSGGGGVRQGLRYARGRQQLWLPLAMMALVGLLAFNFAVALPLFTRDDLHGGGGTYGLLSAALSVGSVVGSLLVGLLRHPRRIYLAGAALAFGATLALTAATQTTLEATAALVVTGVAAFAFVTMTSTTLQLHSSPAYRARVMALFGLFYLGTTPIGATLAGWIGQTIGPRAILLVGSVACLAAGGLALAVHTPPDPDGALLDLVHPAAPGSRVTP
jgi:MFS family permease